MQVDPPQITEDKRVVSGILRVRLMQRLSPKSEMDVTVVNSQGGQLRQERWPVEDLNTHWTKFPDTPEPGVTR